MPSHIAEMSSGQYSVTPACHGADLGAYFSDLATTPSSDFRHGFQKNWGDFIYNTPVISVIDATAGYVKSTIPSGDDGKIGWPACTEGAPWQMDLNMTGGIMTKKVRRTRAPM